jgi:hypothetical protein
LHIKKKRKEKKKTRSKVASIINPPRPLKSRLSHVQRFNAAQAERLRIYDVPIFELVKAQELIPGSPEGSEKRSREKLHVEISKLESLEAENDRKIHKALFTGAHASVFLYNTKLDLQSYSDFNLCARYNNVSNILELFYSIQVPLAH